MARDIGGRTKIDYRLRGVVFKAEAILSEILRDRVATGAFFELGRNVPHGSPPVLLQFTGIARLCWDMRDAGGRRTNILTTAIGVGRPLTAPENEAVAGLTGEIRHAWARLKETAAQISDTSRLQEALKQNASRSSVRPTCPRAARRWRPRTTAAARVSAVP